MNSNKERSEEAEKLLNFGFREFSNYKLLNKGDTLATINVWYGKDKTVDAVVAKDVVETVRKSLRNKYDMKLTYKEPLKAPIKKGDIIAKLTLTYPQGETKDINLVAKNDVDEVSVFKKFVANLKYLLLGDK